MNFDLTKENLLIDRKTRKKKQDSSTWALSYGDMVTALLCFFIIFYALEKQVEKRKLNPIQGYGTTEGILHAHQATGIDTDYDYAMESLTQIPGVFIEKTSSFVDINFKRANFFEKGKADLSEEGILLINDVIKRLSKIEGRYLLEIQGHADPTPVKDSKARWWNSNMELSVLRALNVHTYLAQNYIQEDHLIVAGYGTQQKQGIQQADLANMNRRISLRLQLVK